MRHPTPAPDDTHTSQRAAQSRRTAANDMRRELEAVTEDLRRAMAEAGAPAFKTDPAARTRHEQKQKALFTLRQSLEETSERLESEASALEAQARGHR